MNKIYKVIWSKVRNCYIVVSELAKSHDSAHGTRSRSECARKAAVLAAFVLTTSLAAVPVWAADANGNITNNGASTMTGSNPINQSKNSVIYGSENAVNNSENAVVVGNGNTGNTNSVVIGNGALSNAEGQIVIGRGKANGEAVGSIVIGNNETIANTSQSVLIGNDAKANGSGQGIIVIGNGAMANSNAAGYTDDNKKYIPAGIVLGEYSYSSTRAGKDGYLSDKKGDRPSTAFNEKYWDAVWTATANPMAIGNVDTDANGNGGDHTGHGILTRQITGVAAGTDLTDAVNVAQLKAAVAQFSGGGSGTGGSGVHDYSVKSVDTANDNNYNNTGATGSNALAAGVNASATGENAVAIGTGAEAEGKGATVIGQYASATGDYATAFGGEQTDTTAAAANNMASGKNAVAFGERSKASGSNSTAFGQGTQATEKRATAFGQRTQATQSNATAFGIDTLASGQNATAFGNLTVASNYGATAFGNKNKATGQYATAWGGGDKVIGKDTNGKDIKQGTVASGTYATAFGERTEASGESATAFGSDSTASGKNSLAFGENSTAAGENSVAALGGTTAQNAANAAAIGKDAQAKLADSVALGSGAVADRQSGTKGYDAATGAESTQTSATWVANANAIAVGNGSTLTRQITGVAAGSQDTDAVNLAQLKEVGKLAGKHTTVSVGGQKATADDTLVKGGNLELNRKTIDGQANYDVALNKDVVLGEQEEHKGGSLVVNSVAQFRKAPGSKETYPVKEAVKIDGTTVSVVKNDGTNDQRQVVLGVGQDVGGYVALFDKTGKTPTYIFNAISSGITYLKDGKEFNRLEYGDITNGSTQFIATLDDGQIYAGDITSDGKLDEKGFARTLNQKTTINGSVTDKDKLTDGNIGVVSNGTDTLTVKLAKDLKDLNSVTTGKTVMNDSGIKITNDAADEKKNVVINGDKISYGGNQVTNMGSGADGTADGKPTYNTDTNGANIGDVKNIASSTVQPVIDTVNKGWELDVNGTKQKAVTPDSPKVNLIQGQNITITGDATNTDNVTIATADDVRFNTVRVGGDADGKGGYTGGIVIGKQSGGDSANPDENDYITGLKNINWDSNKIQSGRAATEDQLKKVADDIKQGTVAGDVYVTGGEVAYHTDGGSDNGQPTVNDGTGKLTLTENNKTSKIEITGLHDYYVTNGTVTDDGKTLELTRNDRDENGNPQKISIDLGNVLKHDLHLVQNPAAGSNGKYTVDTKTGTVTLKVQNGDGTDASDITIGGFEELGKGLKFGANQKGAESGSNPVTNQLGSTINITGAGDKTLDKYSGKNLLTSVEQDADGNTTIHVLMDKNISADGVTVGQAGTDGVKGKDGEVGQAGTIGINGKNGVKGDGGKEGITTTIIRTEKGQPGENGATGKPGVDGKDITRIVYQNDQDQVDGKDGSHTVATLDDGLKFSGDDNKVITKKLNEQLQFVGGADKSKLTEKNIGINELEDGKLTIQLVNTPNLGENGNLTAGSAQIGWFAGDTLDMTKDGTNPSGNKAGAGSYATGLSNTDWNVTNPEYVSGRAATEDQLAKVSEAIGNATTAAGKRTVVTVNDKSNPAEATPNATAGAYGDYDSTGGNLMIAAKKDSDGVLTYNIKLNDQLAIGQKGEPGVAGKDGKDGKDGKVTVETKGGTTVVIGHDGEPGKDGKDGLFVTGKDGADGVSITGPNGVDGTDGKVGISGTDGKDAVSISGKDGVGHIGLTGPKGADGKNATADIHVKNGQVGVDGTDGHGGKDGMDRVVYEDHNGVTHEVATMDDGQKYAGDFGDGASVKLNKTVTIKGKVKDGAKEDDFVDGNIAIVANKKGEDGELLIKLNKDLTGLNSATYTTSTKNGDVTTTSKTVVDGTGLKIDNGPSITNTGIDGGSKKITNVADGEISATSKDAVNGSQLNAVKTLAGQHTTVEAGSKNITVKEGANSTGGKNYTVDLAKDVAFGDSAKGDKTVAISGTNGTVTAGTGDNKVTVDGSKGQIIAGGDNGVKIGNIAGGDSSLTIYDKDGKATNQTDQAGKYVTNLGNKTWNKDGSYVSGRAATEDQLHQVESNVNKQIADVNTKIDKVDKHHTEVTVNGGTPAKADGAYTDGNLQLKQTTGEDGQKVYDLKLNDQLKVGQKGDAGKAGKDGNVTVETKDGTTVVIGHDGKDGKDGRDGLFVTGKDGKDGKSGVSITGPNGAAGTDGVDGKVGIAGKDGRDAVSIAGKDGVGHIGLTGPKGADGEDGTNIDISTVLGKGTLDRNQNEVKGEDKDGTKDQAARIQYQTTVKEADGTTKTITHEVATMDDGMKYGDDFGNTAKVKLNHQLDIVGDINAGKKDGDKKATKDDLSDGNIGIVATDTVYNDDGTVKENGKMTVKLAKNLKGLNSIESNSVTTGNTTINNGGLTVKTGDSTHQDITIQQGDVNMGGNKIEGVAPGKISRDSTDAVNGSQLYAADQAISYLGGAVNKLGTRVDRVGAGSAALAALHPLDFDPDDKWDFAAGYGHYRGANAAAVGAYYRPNEDTMFSIGGSFGGGENMFNAGVSIKLGQGNHISTSRVAMAKEMEAMRRHMAEQDALIAKLESMHGMAEGPEKSALFPDVAENHLGVPVCDDTG